jgi:putative ABC transport system ATP-binding protein
LVNDGAAAAACVGVVKTYATDTGRVEALRGVDAEFPRAAVSAVVGASGSGKSTLLRLLAALDRPDAGDVLVGRVAVSGLAPTALRGIRRELVGYVFQRPSDNFIPYLTVGEHLRLAGAVDEDEAAEALDLLGLGMRRNRLPGELSGGEQQRAAFAQVLVSGASLVVADEPTAELDARSSAALLEALGALARRGSTFVVATHDRAVTGVADDAIELEHGRVKGAAAFRDGEPERALAARRRPPAGPVVAEAVEVVKRFGLGGEEVAAVDGVSIAVRAGELAALVGRSGSGKTTLLNLLAGWEHPDGGRVRIAGLADGARGAAVPWSEVAVLPQRFGLLPELTVRENVEYPARLAGRLDEARLWTDELLGALDLHPFEDRFPLETSIGQQQRAALCRALALRPPLLLADEPTGHQDAGSALAVVCALRAVAERGTACLVATHDEEIAALFDTTHAMAGGRLVERAAAP